MYIYISYCKALKKITISLLWQVEICVGKQKIFVMKSIKNIIFDIPNSGQNAAEKLILSVLSLFL